MPTAAVFYTGIVVIVTLLISYQFRSWGCVSLPTFHDQQSMRLRDFSAFSCQSLKNEPKDPLSAVAETIMVTYYRRMCPGREEIPVIDGPHGGGYSFINALLLACEKKEAVVAGYEAWRVEHLARIQSCIYSSSVEHSLPVVPAKSFPYHIYLSYNDKVIKAGVDEMMKLTKLGLQPSQYTMVTYGDIQHLWEDRERVGKLVWRNATNMKQADMLKSMLSTMNAFEALELIAASDKEYGLYIEDDAIPIHGAALALRALAEQVNEVQADLVFMGTCLGIHDASFNSTDIVQASREPQLVLHRETRCFNAVLISKTAATVVLTAGVQVDDYKPIDHLFNQLILSLGFEKTYYVEPPLFYEGSKAAAWIPC